MSPEARSGFRLVESTLSANLSVKVAEKVSAIDDVMRAGLGDASGIVNRLETYAMAKSGKRIRGVLHVLSAGLCGYEGSTDVILGAVVESIHLATLIHDDVVDDAPTRRGVASLPARFGNKKSILFGDYLYAQAMRLAIRADSLEVMRCLSETTSSLVRGELLQATREGDVHITESDYMEVVELKTAELFACCCELGGLLGEVSSRQRSALRRFALGLGKAYQIVDDVMDLSDKPGEIGKARFTDIRDGKISLPIIRLLRENPDSATPLVKRIFEEGVLRESSISELQDMLIAGGYLQQARSQAARISRSAAGELAHFPSNECRSALEAFCDVLTDRVA